MKHIAIIGGGFSGSMTAVNLARLTQIPLKVSLINYGYPKTRGVAYSTRRPEHLLNVAARNMSALPDYPNHFIDWLRTRHEYTDIPDAELRETFIPRRIYGDYLRSLALPYTRPVDQRPGADIEFIEDEAVDIQPAANGASVVLASGAKVAADKVLLATGNEPPTALPGSEALAQHSGYAANPWVNWESKLPPASENIILLGTGLTTVDAILTLLALDWRGTIHAVSRNGLLPQPHFKGVDYPDFPSGQTDLAGMGLAALVQLIEEHCKRLRGQGMNPAIVIDKMRPHTQQVWQSFTIDERREFTCRHAARWNTIRHRIAQPIHQAVTAAVAEGRLKITRSGITSLEAAPAGIRVNLSDPKGTALHLDGALVINCTGPHTRFSATRSQLLQNVMARGLAQPDEMDMGIRVSSDFAVTENNGRRSRFLFAIGPLLRGTLWESIAVPELRGQALRIAQTLLDECKAAPGLSRAPRWTTAEEPAVMEYAI